ncbi:FimD/PapC N-terminal domain-containing protein [Pantoea sp. Z09]|uniref:FimD/PapC N-terminal domain-containing protein n=1 Tax=Pantoea sp. Z09 TaxID=2886821 RepID=UPI001EFC7238|nr:FimD/PapC N-terminal domain-containing protein [Pantoea sp. Z09]
MRIKHLTCCVLLALIAPSVTVAADNDIQFNTDVLDVNDQKNIDLSQFSRAGYVMPGDYTMTVHLNKSSLQEESITYLPSEQDEHDSEPCLTKKLVEHIGFKPEVAKKLTWWHDGQCLNLQNPLLNGMSVKGDLAAQALNISIPQAYLEYASATWDPPSRWDDGIAGVLADYNLSLQSIHGMGETASSQNISGNGTVGANFGP